MLKTNHLPLKTNHLPLKTAIKSQNIVANSSKKVLKITDN